MRKDQVRICDAFLWFSGGKAPWREGARPRYSRLDVRGTQYGVIVVKIPRMADRENGISYLRVMRNAQRCTFFPFPVIVDGVE